MRPVNALFNIVLPVFGIIFAGFWSRRVNLLGAAASDALNRFAYYIALPPLLFLSTTRVSIGVILNWPFIATHLTGIVLVLLLTIPAGRWVFGHRDLGRLTLHSLAGVFANVVYMGIPLFIAAFGRENTVPAIVAVLFSNLILIASIVCVEIGLSKGSPLRIARDVGQALGRNPILIAMLAGFLVAYLEWPIPLAVERFLDMLAGAAGPTALFALGLTLYGQPLKGDLKEIGWITLVKLVIHPLVTWALVRFVFVLDPFWGQAAILLAATPTGTLVFVIAQKYRVYSHHVASVVLVTTALSMATLAVILTLLGRG